MISIGSNDLFTKSNYQNFQRFYPSDLSIAGDAQATLPLLTDAVLSGMTPARRASNAAREARWREAYSPKVLSDKQLRLIYAYVRSIPEPPPLEEIPELNFD